MSPLLGSSGGSSEYAFRGTLDDWPVDFAVALAAQNLSNVAPSTAVTATLTITGLNYKARVTVDHPNATVAVTSEFGVAVTDGREVYAARKESDTPLFIRDQSVISIRLQPTSGTLSDFQKTYTVPVKVGKRTANWEVSTRAIDETPTTTLLVFNPLINQELGIAATSNTVDIAGLENGFAFPISVIPDQVGGNVTFFKNSVEFTGSSTVVNGDRIYLSTLTPSSYSTPRTFSVQVGTFTTSWGILTRDAVTTINPFSFTGIASANQSGFGYTSGFITISGADPGIGLPVSMTGGSFQILLSDGITPRYPAPPPATPPYWQTSPSTAFNGDKINVRVFSATIPPNYNTTTSGILTVSDQSATFNVTTRPAPIDTIPATFTFTNLSDQDRGVLVTSGIVTLTDMLAGATGTASLTSSSPLIGAQFNVNGGAWITPPATANVGLGNTIRLRLTTPVADSLEGVRNSTATFRVDGTDTTTNISTPTDNPQGYTTFTGFQDYIWNVDTKARTCPITPFTLSSISDRPLNSDNTVTFTVGGYDTDCRMRVEVISASTNYNFTQLNGATPPGGIAKTLTDVAPGSTVTLSVRASDLYSTDVTATVTVTNDNTPDTVTPERTYSTTWTVKTVADTTPAEVILTGPTADVIVGTSFILTWSTVNCILVGGTVKSVSGTNWTPLPTSLSGSVAIPVSSTGLYSYSMQVYANPSAVNSPPLPSDATGIYQTSNTVTVNVVDDADPTITNTVTNTILGTADNFGSVIDIPLSTPTTSDNFTLSDFTATLTGTIVAPTGVTANFLATDTLANQGTVRTFSPTATLVNRSFRLSLTSSANYLTTNTIDVVFDWLPPGSLNRVEVLRKSFSVKTQACVPTTTSTGSAVLVNGTSTCNVTYYTNVTWANSTQSVPQFTSDNFPYTPQGTTTKGVITNGTGIAGTLSGGGNVTWRQYIDTLWDVYVTNTSRPPRQTEIESAFSSFPLSGATTLAVYQAQILSGQIQGGTGITPTNAIRNTTIPLSNSCDTAFYP